MSARALTRAAVDWQPGLVRAAAIGAGAIVVLLLVPVAWLEYLARGNDDLFQGWGWFGFSSLAALSTAGVGCFLAVRRPANAVGWLLVAIGFTWVAGGLGDVYGGYGLLVAHDGMPGALAVASLSRYTWPVLFALLVLTVVCFPEGRPASRLRRLVALGAVATTTVICTVGILSNDEFDPPLERLTPAFQLLGPGWGVVRIIAIFGLFACLLAGWGDIVLRLRRARGVERRQLLCFGYVALLLPLSLGLCLVLKSALGVGEAAIGVTIAAAIVLLPVSTAIAILRYRLYAIDRVVNRTLVYGVLTALLGAAYLVLVVSLTALIATVASDPSPLAIALATVAVTAAFLPLRARVQRVVDRRFARRRFAAVSMVEEFAVRLRHDREPPERIGAVLAEALRDPSLVVAFPRLRGDEWLDPYGAPAKGTHACATTVVGPAGEPTALLLHDPVLDEDPDVLGAVSAAARLPLEIARLRVEVRGQLEDVRASRARIVAAGDAERRRVERDIHDGAQQRLVALALTLQVARRTHETLDVAELLDRTAAELSAAVEDLRELARGVYPAVLREDGLAEALRALARRTPLPVDVEADLPRLPAGIEAAAYFLASEAVTNAVRHAAATHIEIAAEVSDDRLLVVVVDDGAGGADPGRGSGLAGLADRLAALGGAMRIESTPGAGTRVIGELPCES